MTNVSGKFDGVAQFKVAISSPSTLENGAGPREL